MDDNEKLGLIYLLQNFQVKTLLDLGANTGYYSSFIKQIAPNVECFMIEANSHCKHHLENTTIPFRISCLSNEKRSRKLYMNKDNEVCTGVSYLRELTHHYTEDVFERVETELLDDVIYETFNEFKAFDYIKMDTQGSERDIILSGNKTIKQAKLIQIETAVLQYNQGAPLEEELVSFMSDLGFKVLCNIGNNLWNGNVSAKNLVFINTKFAY